MILIKEREGSKQPQDRLPDQNLSLLSKKVLTLMRLWKDLKKLKKKIKDISKKRKNKRKSQSNKCNDSKIYV